MKKWIDSYYLFSAECRVLITLLKQEFIYFYSKRNKFFKYLKNLFFKHDSFFFNFIRIIILIPFFKFSIDLFFFIFYILFCFYYVFFNWLFSFFKKFILFFFENENIKQVLVFFLDWLSYIILFKFFVNLNAKRKKKNLTVFYFFIDYILDIVYKFAKRRLGWRRVVFSPFLLFFEILWIVLHMCLSIFFEIILGWIIKIIWYICLPFIYIYNIISAMYYFFLLKKAPELMVDDVYLFDIVEKLQRYRYYKPNYCTDNLIIEKAYKEYKIYKKQRKEFKDTYVELNDKGIHIYIELKKLLRGTRYQPDLSPISFIEIFKVWFPYSIFLIMFFFFYYFLLGIIALIYILFSPFIFFIIFPGYILLKLFEFLYKIIFMFFFDKKKKNKKKKFKGFF